MAIGGLLERFKKGLAKTAQLFNFRSWFGRTVDQSFLDDLESRLIQADVGVVATTRIIDHVRAAYSEKTADENLIKFVKAELKGLLEDIRPGTLRVAPSRQRSTSSRASTVRARQPRSPSSRSISKIRAIQSCWPLAIPSARPLPTSSRCGPVGLAARSSREHLAPIRPASRMMHASGR